MAVPRFASVLLHGASVWPGAVSRTGEPLPPLGNAHKRGGVVRRPRKQLVSLAYVRPEARSYWLAGLATSVHFKPWSRPVNCVWGVWGAFCVLKEDPFEIGKHSDKEGEGARVTDFDRLYSSAGNAGMEAFFESLRGCWHLDTPIPAPWFLPLC